MHFTKTPIGRLRLIGFLEGISFLLLLFIAMPLKYFAGLPETVKYTGMVHGVLFILYCFALLDVKMTHKWKITKLLIAFTASVIPFGPFIFDARLRREMIS